MGVVYLVADREAPRPFILKACQPGDQALASRFAREAEIWVGFGSHPNVTKAFWVRSLDDQLFVAAEYVDGSETGRGSLADVVGADVSLRQVLRWIVQFCSGLSHALARGLVAHRDVKPANLLLNREGTVKIADFGLGKLGQYPASVPTAATVEATGLVGTVPYMAPEQFLQPTVDHRCDIYAFGIVLYQLCSGGAYPYTVNDPSQPPAYAAAHLHGAIRPIATPFWPLILKCLERSPAARWQSPEQLAVAAHDLAVSLGLPCPPFVGPQPSSLEELYVKAQSLGALGRPKEALASIDEYLREAPDAYWAWTEKGRILMEELGRDQEAEEATRRSLALDPGNSHAWNNLGVVLNRQGRARESCDAYQQAFECDPLNTGAMMNAAQPLCAVRRFDDAATLLCRALRLVPSKGTLKFNAGNVVGLMLQAQALQPAEKVARALIEADPRNSQAWHNLGVTLAATGRREEGLLSARRALECEPENAATRFFLVRLYAEAGRLDDAIRELDWLLTDSRHVSKARCFKAQLLAGTGRVGEGIALLENHLREFPHDDGAWFVLCDLAEHIGDSRKALRAAEESYTLLQRQGGRADPENVRWVRDKIGALRARIRA